jgi:hypothetical protein
MKIHMRQLLLGSGSYIIYSRLLIVNPRASSGSCSGPSGLSEVIMNPYFNLKAVLNVSNAEYICFASASCVNDGRA